MTNKIAILSLIFILWQMEMLEESPLDSPTPSGHLGNFHGYRVRHAI